MSWISGILILLGGLVACLNFYLSFLAVPLHRLRTGRAPDRVPSGLPLIGSFFLIAGALLAPIGAPLLVALVLLVVDTGGPHWLLGVMAWQLIAGRRGRS